MHCSYFSKVQRPPAKRIPGTAISVPDWKAHFLAQTGLYHVIAYRFLKLHQGVAVIVREKISRRPPCFSYIFAPSEYYIAVNTNCWFIARWVHCYSLIEDHFSISARSVFLLPCSHNFITFTRFRRYENATFTAPPKSGIREIVFPVFVKFLGEYPLVEAHLEIVMNERAYGKAGLFLLEDSFRSPEV